MPSVWNWLTRFSGKKTSTTRRTKDKSRPGLESLERREVPSASGLGGLHPFALLNGRINSPDRPAVVQFQIQGTRTYSDRAIPVILGLKAVPANGSTVAPKIVALRSLSARTAHTIQTKGGVLFDSTSIPLSGPATYAVRVKGASETTGPFQIAVFLPGDVNGDGRVDRIDQAAVRAAYGSQAGGPRYIAAADFGQTGKVGLVDLGVVRRNLGSSLSILGINAFPPGTLGSA